MAERSRFFDYLKTREGVISLVLVVTCGLALAFFAGRTYFDPPPRVYSLDFKNAEWLTHMFKAGSRRRQFNPPPLRRPRQDHEWVMAPPPPAPVHGTRFPIQDLRREAGTASRVFRVETVFLASTDSTAASFP